MIKPIKILSISSALVLGLSLTQVAHAQTLEEIAEAEAACAEALADGSPEALEQFRRQFGDLPTACTARAQVSSAAISSALFDVNEGPSAAASSSVSVSVSVGTGNGGGNGGGGNGGGGNGGGGNGGGGNGGGNGGDGGSGLHPIVQMLSDNQTDGTGVVDATLGDLQGQLDAM